MWSRLLSYDPSRRLELWLDIFPDGRYQLRHVDKAWRSVLAHNAAYRDANPRAVNGRNMIKVAEIPAAMWMWLKEQGIADDPKALNKFLNDSDYRNLRTWGGRL